MYTYKEQKSVTSLQGSKPANTADDSSCYRDKQHSDNVGEVDTDHMQIADDRRLHQQQ